MACVQLLAQIFRTKYKLTDANNYVHIAHQVCKRNIRRNFLEGFTVHISTEDIKSSEDPFEARRIVIHIINLLSPLNKLKGVSVDELVNYGEAFRLDPEVIISVVQQLVKEELILETSKNRFLNKYPPLNVETEEKKDLPTNNYKTLKLSDQAAHFQKQEELEKMSELLEQSNLVITSAQLSHIKEEYDEILQSGNPNAFFKGYPSDAEIGKRVGIDKRKVQGARALLGLLNDRDLKINFDRDKFLNWLTAPKNSRMGSKEFAEELGVSYSTFKRKKALWEAYLKIQQFKLVSENETR